MKSLASARFGAALVLLAVAGAGAAPGQETATPSAPETSPATTAETAPEATPPSPVVVVATGTGTLAVTGGGGASETPLPWLDTAAGTLVALPPVVARLGGRLDLGLLGASYTLTVGDTAFVIVSGSPTATRGTDIVAFSQPALDRDGMLYVPLDLLAASYGSLAGVSTSWDPAARRLTLARASSRELPVEISLVHVQEVSTLVLRTPESFRYRVERQPGVVDIVPVGDRFVPAPARSTGDDPFVRAVRVTADRARIELAAGVEADDYALREPFRIVVDLFRPREAPAGTAVQPAAPPARRSGIRTVVLDPGHGGDESGAVGPEGTMEKDLTLAIARAMAERLRAELGVEVVLTRNDDVGLGLDERSALANQHKADLFVSVHLNSTHGGRARGAETYFLSLAATDDRAAELAAVENLTGGEPAAPGSEEFDLQLLLWDLAQSRHLAASQRLATMIQEELNRALELPDRGVKQAPFRVLAGAAMPAVLVELGFLSNRDEELRLRDAAYRAELAATVTRAVARFKSEAERAGGAAGAGP